MLLLCCFSLLTTKKNPNTHKTNQKQAKPPGAGRRASAPVMQTKGSKFVKFQEARLQEAADEVPEGATPRTLSLQLRGEVTRSLKAGDQVVLAGVFLPEPFTGWKALR